MENNFLFAFIGNLRPTEILIILLVVLILFGADRLPKLARSMGKSIREFKKAATEMSEELKTSIEAEESAAPQPVKAEVDPKPQKPQNPEDTRV